MINSESCGQLFEGGPNADFCDFCLDEMGIPTEEELIGEDEV